MSWNIYWQSLLEFQGAVFSLMHKICFHNSSIKQDIPVHKEFSLIFYCLVHKV